MQQLLHEWLLSHRNVQRWHLTALYTAGTTTMLSHRNVGIESLQLLLDCY
jgi:hypothetical protein